MATHFGNWLRMERKARKLTVRDLAKQMQVSKSSVHAVQEGHALPTEKFMHHLSYAFRVEYLKIKRVAWNDLIPKDERVMLFEWLRDEGIPNMLVEPEEYPEPTYVED